MTLNEFALLVAVMRGVQIVRDAARIKSTMKDFLLHEEDAFSAEQVVDAALRELSAKALKA